MADNEFPGPVLLGVQKETTAGLSGKEQRVAQKEESRWQDLPPHKDEDQVDLDVKRSFVYYPRGKSTIMVRHDFS
jgi:TBC1 domain family member 20